MENDKAARQRFVNSLRHEGEDMISVREGKRLCYEKEDVTFERRDVVETDSPYGSFSYNGHDWAHNYEQAVG